MKIGASGIVLSLAGIIATADNTNANIDRKRHEDFDKRTTIPRSFDPREFRPPIIGLEEGPPPAQVTEPSKADPRKRLIQALEIQLPSLKENIIDKGSFDKQTIQNLNELHMAGVNYLKIVNKGTRKEEVKLLEKMGKAVEQLRVKELNPGHRLIIAIEGSVNGLIDLIEVEKTGPGKKD